MQERGDHERQDALLCGAALAAQRFAARRAEPVCHDDPVHHVHRHRRHPPDARQASGVKDLLVDGKAGPDRRANQDVLVHVLRAEQREGEQDHQELRKLLHQPGAQKSARQRPEHGILDIFGAEAHCQRKLSEPDDKQHADQDGQQAEQHRHNRLRLSDWLRHFPPDHPDVQDAEDHQGNHQLNNRHIYPSFSVSGAQTGSVSARCTR